MPTHVTREKVLRTTELVRVPTNTAENIFTEAVGLFNRTKLLPPLDKDFLRLRIDRANGQPVYQLRMGSWASEAKRYLQGLIDPHQRQENQLQPEFKNRNAELLKLEAAYCAVQAIEAEDLATSEELTRKASGLWSLACNTPDPAPKPARRTRRRRRWGC